LRKTHKYLKKKVEMIMNRIEKQNNKTLALIRLLLLFTLSTRLVQGYVDTICPPQELILPCRCTQKGSEIQIWCSHSDLPSVLSGIKSTSKAINRPIDELILENNFLPSLPGRAFVQLQITRLMLRHNGLERLSAGWLNDVESHLVEIFIVERGLRSIPDESFFGLRNLEALTIQSEGLKRCPEFSGMQKLKYINIESNSIVELSPLGMRDLLGLESFSIAGNKHLSRLEANLFSDLPKLRTINVQNNGIEWIHLRAFSSGLQSLQNLDFSRNRITNAGMVGRAIKDLRNLEMLNLSYNFIEVLSEASFVDLPSLKELRLNDNLIQELHHGAFHRVPSLKVVHLENNHLRHVSIYNYNIIFF
jgi:Leucine-rich repeat (LRR) protein